MLSEEQAHMHPNRMIKTQDLKEQRWSVGNRCSRDFGKSLHFVSIVKLKVQTV